MTGNSSNTTSSGVPEEKILIEYFDKKGIEKLVPEFFKEKSMSILETTQETREFTGNREALEIAGLEAFDLGRPTCPDFIDGINPEKALKTKPQAWEKNGKWYYNWVGAMKEAEYLGKKLPSKEDWERICKPYGKYGERMVEELGLSFAGCRNYSNGDYDYQGGCAKYWSNKPTIMGGFAMSTTENTINPKSNNDGKWAFPVRCLKNTA